MPSEQNETLTSTNSSAVGQPNTIKTGHATIGNAGWLQTRLADHGFKLVFRGVGWYKIGVENWVLVRHYPVNQFIAIYYEKDPRPLYRDALNMLEYD